VAEILAKYLKRACKKVVVPEKLVAKFNQKGPWKIVRNFPPDLDIALVFHGSALHGPKSIKLFVSPIGKLFELLVDSFP
jgi:hypothetical protein